MPSLRNDAAPATAADRHMRCIPGWWHHRVERLFEQAESDRSKAYELKGEFDRLGVFDLYEDRFVDLFKKPDQS